MIKIFIFKFDLNTRCQNSQPMKYFILSLFIFVPSVVNGQCEDIEVSITSNTGQWGNEMSWELFDADYNQIASFQGTSDFTSDELALCLPVGCYIFQAYDVYEDGWNGGSLQISYDGEEISFEMANAAQDFLTLGLYMDDCSFEIIGCTNSEAVNFNANATQDDGSCIFDIDFEVNGTARTYLYYAPENLVADAPLLFAFHGWTGTSNAIMQYSGLNDLADENGFAVCYPQGLLDNQGNTHWNSGLTISSVDDLEFIVALAEYLQEENNLSADCTFSCGYSNGGFMGYHMACEYPGLFRGIVSVNGTMSAADWTSCDPSEPTAIMEIHGTADDEVPYSGMPDIGGGWGPSGSSPAIIDFWVEENQCAVSESYDIDDITDEDGTTTDVVKHSDGINGNQVWFYTVNGGPHDWPGWYNAETDMNASDEVWKFMDVMCNETVSIEENTGISNVYLYPNPSISDNSQITIKGVKQTNNVIVSIYDSAMRKIKYTNKLMFNINELSKGIYIVTIQTEGNTHSLKLIIQ